jgi:PAS domain S-box-containing protein
MDAMIYRKLIRESTDIATIIDLEGTMTYVSPSVRDSLGYEPDELVGENGFEYQHPEDQEAVATAIEALQTNPDEKQLVETRFRRADGSWCWIEATMQNCIDDEDIGGILVNSRDISTRKQQQRQFQDLSNEYETLLETVQDGIFFLTVEKPESRYVFRFERLGQAYEALTGITTGDVRGKTPTEVFGDELGAELHANYRRCAEARDPISYQEEVPVETEARFWQTNLAPVITDGTVTEIIGITRDVTDRVQREETFRRIYEIGADADLKFDEKVRQLLEVGREYLDLPYGFFTRIDEDTQEIVVTLGDHGRLQPGETASLDESYCRKTVESDGLVAMENSRRELGETDPAYERFELGCYVGTKVRVGADLYGTFCFGALEARSRSFTPHERKLVKLLGQWAGHELERAQFEDRLRGLHRVSRELLAAETADEVARISIEAGRDIFDMPMGTCWEYNAERDVLRLLAASEDALGTTGETPTFERGDELVWESFDSGEIRMYADLNEKAKTYNPQMDLRSEIHIPCGEKGVSIFSSTESRAFDDIDIESLRLLQTLVHEAMIAVEREESLVARSETLQRQKEQLDEFAKVVSHDLRSPLSIAKGRAKLLAEESESEHLRPIVESLTRMEEIISDTLTLARQGQVVADQAPVELVDLVGACWKSVSTEEATIEINDEPTIQGDQSRLRHVFENLFRNAIEHGGPDVTVSVGQLGEYGIYVEDTGPGIPQDDRDAVFEPGHTSTNEGTGFGLTIIKRIAEAHGWTVELAQGTDGGARFEFTDVTIRQR